MTRNAKKNMKRTTRNNIIRYIVATVLVAIVLLIMVIVNLAIYWLTDISGWPVNHVAIIIGFIWLCWFVGKRITIKEEKAKRYDEALERARNWKEKSGMPKDRQGILDDIFPELKESEDERIRKMLIEFFSMGAKNNSHTNCIADKDIIAWLEKQSKQKSVNYDSNEGERMKGTCKFYLNLQKVNSPHSISDIDKCIAWLEKQGDSPIKWYKNTKDYKPQKYHSVLMKTTHGIAEGEWNGEHWIQYRWSCIIKDSDVIAWMVLSSLEKQGEQKPADKIESKFKAGNWIVWQDKSYKVNYNGCGYELIDQNGLSTSLEYGTIDEGAHLWDITKDAKNGDVLSDGTGIFIFKDLLSDGSVMSYCDYDTDSGESDAFCPLLVNLMCSKITPATKEQRDILFAKIHEAGYIWDAKKKELKKIEQKSHRLISAEAKEAMYDKPVWSEKDEKIITGIINDIQKRLEDCHLEQLAEIYFKEIDWLKSLKQRIGGE